MQIIQAPRASAILYSLLVTREDRRPWLLPANICPIVPLTFFKAGTGFDLVDISGMSLHMDLDQAQQRLKQRDYGGVLYAHTYAESSTPTTFFMTIKTSHPDLLVIDDRCLCSPDLDPDPGSAADVVLYSTGYAKIAELNFGGYAFIKDAVEYEHIRLPFNPTDYEATQNSYKQVLRTRMLYEYHDVNWLKTEQILPAWYDYREQIKTSLRFSLQQREELNGIYLEGLPQDIQLPRKYQNWRFNIRVKNQAQVLQAIFTEGLFASAHYASLAGIMVEGSAPQAEILAGEIINLFNDHHFTPEQADQICKIIKLELK